MGKPQFIRRSCPPKVTLLDGKDVKALKLTTFGVRAPTTVRVHALVELELQLDDTVGLTADDSERQWLGQVVSVVNVLPGTFKDILKAHVDKIKRKKKRKAGGKPRTKRRRMRHARRNKR